MDRYGTQISMVYPLVRRDLFLVSDDFGIVSFKMKDQPIVLEVGDKVTGGDRDFKWTLKPKLPNDDDFGLLVKDETKNKELLHTKDKHGAIINIGDDIRYTSPQKHIWALFLFDLDLGHQARKDFIVIWTYKIFFGTNTKSQIEIEDLKKMDSELFTEFGKRYEFNIETEDKFFYFVFPKGLDNNFSLISVKSSLNIDFDKTQELTYTNEFGVEVQYNVYRTFYKQSGSVTAILEKE